MEPGPDAEFQVFSRYWRGHAEDPPQFLIRLSLRFGGVRAGVGSAVSPGPGPAGECQRKGERKKEKRAP